MTASKAHRVLARIVSGVGLARGAAALPLPALLLGGLLAAPALGQVQSVQPYHIVVTTNDAMIRSGNGKAYYGVAKLGRGDVLSVDAEGGEWKRVAYPAGAGAFIGAEQAQLDSSGSTATLTAPSQLKAANVMYGLRGSWKPLLESPLPVGAKLNVLEVLRAEDGGTVTAYRVAAPAGSKGFVPDSVVRKATEAEIQAYAARTSGADAAASPTHATPAPAQPAPTSTPSDPAAVEPRPPAPAGNEPPADTSLVDPMVKPTDTAVPTPGADQTGAEPAPAEPPPLVIDQSVPPRPADDTGAEPLPEAERPVATPQELEAAFKAVHTQAPGPGDGGGGEGAELDELMAEFRRTLDTIPDDRANHRLRLGLQQRYEMLRLRADIQDQLRAARRATEVSSEDSRRLAERLRELDRNRSYTIIGRVVPSTIYDGVRLPLMYRVLSVGGNPPRTLGYLKPDAGFDIDSKVGLVVGVVGQATMDRSLNLNIIRPDHVDVIGKADGR